MAKKKTTQKDKTTSEKVAKIASKQLKDENTSKKDRSTAASALAQAVNRKPQKK
jgi:hypothetical protein